MKHKRHSEEEIIAILKEHEAGMNTADLCRKHGISEGTFYNWKARYGGLEVSEAKRLRREPQTAVSDLPRGTACRPPAWWPQARLRHAGTHAGSRLKALAHERRRFGYRRL